MLNNLKKWLLVHNVTSHSVAVFLAGVATLYISDASFAASVNSVLSHFPRLFAAVTAALGIWMKYSSAKKAWNGAERRLTETGIKASQQE